MKWTAIKMGNTRYYWQIEDQNGKTMAEVPAKAGENVALLISQLPEIVDSAKRLLRAMEQKDFFVNGYANGSASISEAKQAMQDECKEYSNLRNLISEV